jgi:hypothetical protein
MNEGYDTKQSLPKTRIVKKAPIKKFTKPTVEEASHNPDEQEDYFKSGFTPMKQMINPKWENGEWV